MIGSYRDWTCISAPSPVHVWLSVSNPHASSDTAVKTQLWPLESNQDAATQEIEPARWLEQLPDMPTND